MNGPGKGHGVPCLHQYSVPADDQWYELPLTGDVVHVAARSPHVVDFWAWRRPWRDAQPHWFRVYVDDQPVDTPGSVCHLGTVVCEGGRYVRHLIERTGSL